VYDVTNPNNPSDVSWERGWNQTKVDYAVLAKSLIKLAEDNGASKEQFKRF
jgi:hypothetical protein